VADHEFYLTLIESWSERFAADIPGVLDRRRVAIFALWQGKSILSRFKRMAKRFWRWNRRNLF
jgi:hypothetical protein